MSNDESGFAISPAQLATIISIEQGDDRSFDEMVQVLGLKKESDFRFANLRSVDFSSSDLKGFDFTGADLSYCFGLNADWDQTTILYGSNLTGSMFQYPQSRDEFFDARVNEADFKALKGIDWSQQISYMYDLRRTPGRGEKTKHFCKRLFIETSDAVVRSDMLRILGSVEQNVEDYIAFLTYICCSQKDVALILAATRVISDRFRNRVAVLNILHSLSTHTDDGVREAAYSGIFRSGHFGILKSQIERAMPSETSGLIRRRYASVISKYVSQGDVVTLIDQNGALYYDFKQPIKPHFILRQAERNDKTPIAVLKIVAELNEAGIPLTLEDSGMQSAVNAFRSVLKNQHAAMRDE